MNKIYSGTWRIGSCVLAGVVWQGGVIEMFELFKKKYPILTVSTITTANQPITTIDALKIFIEHMLNIGYLDKDELSEHLGYLSDAIKRHEQHLKDEVADTKEEIHEAKTELANLKKKLLTCSDDEKEDVEGGIELLEGELVIAAVDIEKASSALVEFNRDKRAFLVDYINTQVHGDDWKSKLWLPHKKAQPPGNVYSGR